MHLQHNKEAAAGSEDTTEDSKGLFYDLEMPVDEKIFFEDGEKDTTEDIPVGSFVTFRYTGEYKAAGPPINPRVSFFRFHSSLFFDLSSIYMVRDDITDWRQILHGKTPKTGTLGCLHACCN